MYGDQHRDPSDVDELGPEDYAPPSNLERKRIERDDRNRDLLCTCGCPDGDNMHLENCESYLRYWELDQLAEIEVWCEHLKNPSAAKFLVQTVVSFVRSTAELGDSCVSDPQQMIFDRITRAAKRKAGVA